ncbi:MAG TPA: HD domain-containing protein [Egibacteraceae bacterium]|nr:HD domain-containing protein [Egibacteraceae bacterium]
MKYSPAIRERSEELERTSLSMWATLSSETKGRDTYEEPDPLRTAFQLDRDRLLHSVGFRKLKHKTHLALGRGHRRTRATHALEVAQIARTLARGLRLNEDLVEAIALGHDVGNTAFGQAGEIALSTFIESGFRHEEHSLRVVEFLENHGAGLNLTWEVRDGIVHHRPDGPLPATLEGCAVRLADDIATATRDLADAVASGTLRPSDLPREAVAVLGETPEQQLATVVTDVVASTADHPELALSPAVEEALAALVDAVRTCLAASTEVQHEANRAIHCLTSLGLYFEQHADRLPPTADDTTQRVVDLVAGLTDRDAVREFERLFLPTS